MHYRLQLRLLEVIKAVQASAYVQFCVRPSASKPIEPIEPAEGEDETRHHPTRIPTTAYKAPCFVLSFDRLIFSLSHVISTESSVQIRFLTSEHVQADLYYDFG